MRSRSHSLLVLLLVRALLQLVLVLVLVRALLLQLVRARALLQLVLAALEPAQRQGRPAEEREAAGQLPQLVPPRERMTGARGPRLATPQQQTSINASSGHHLSRKNERIDQQAWAGQSSSQQIDRS